MILEIIPTTLEKSSMILEIIPTTLEKSSMILEIIPTTLEIISTISDILISISNIIIPLSIQAQNKRKPKKDDGFTTSRKILEPIPFHHLLGVLLIAVVIIFSCRLWKESIGYK